MTDEQRLEELAAYMQAIGCPENAAAIRAMMRRVEELEAENEMYDIEACDDCGKKECVCDERREHERDLADRERARWWAGLTDAEREAQIKWAIRNPG